MALIEWLTEFNDTLADCWWTNALKVLFAVYVPCVVTLCAAEDTRNTGTFWRKVDAILRSRGLAGYVVLGLFLVANAMLLLPYVVEAGFNIVMDRHLFGGPYGVVCASLYALSFLFGLVRMFIENYADREEKLEFVAWMQSGKSPYVRCDLSPGLKFKAFYDGPPPTKRQEELAMEFGECPGFRELRKPQTPLWEQCFEDWGF